MSEAEVTEIFDRLRQVMAAGVREVGEQQWWSDLVARLVSEDLPRVLYDYVRVSQQVKALESALFTPEDLGGPDD